MKKKSLIWLIISLCVIAVAISTLTVVFLFNKHTHEFSEEWSVSSTLHWHECECGEKSNKGEHTYGEWTEKTPASLHQNKIEKRECTVCNFEQTRVVDNTQLHSFDLTSYEKNSNNHWHKCSCGEKSNDVAHTFISDYQVTTNNVEGTVTTVVSQNQKCSICAYTTTPVVVQESSYISLDSASLEGNAKTISEEGVYVLNGTFTNTTFTIDTANVTLIGTGATTSCLKVVLTENTNNTILHGLNMQISGAGNSAISAYGNLTVSKCELLSLWTTIYNENLNIVFDDNSISGEYGLYFNYNDTADKMNVSITNNTFNEITLYPIFFYSASNNSEVGDIDISNNSFINGWGNGHTAKRAAIKFYMDKNISPVVWGDITDTSKLTEPAKDLVRKILDSNNTFDKGGKICSYFNINGIYFDALDE